MGKIHQLSHFQHTRRKEESTDIGIVPLFYQFFKCLCFILFGLVDAFCDKTDVCIKLTGFLFNFIGLLGD